MNQFCTLLHLWFIIKIYYNNKILNKKFEEKLLNAGGSGKKKLKVLKDKLLLQKDSDKITELSVNGTILTNENDIARDI